MGRCKRRRGGFLFGTSGASPEAETALREALRASGYEHRPDRSPGPEDVAVFWKPSDQMHALAKQVRKLGAHVIVANEGFLSPGRDGQPCLSLTKNGPPSVGSWYVGEGDRFTRLGQPLHEWRSSEGEEVVVCGFERGDWSARKPQNFEDVARRQLDRRLRELGRTDLKIRVLTSPPGEAAYEYLNSAAALVTWCDNLANLATLWGVASYRLCPNYPNDAVYRGLRNLTHSREPNREEAFRRMAWSQWSVSELESGKPIEVLVKNCPR